MVITLTLHQTDTEYSVLRYIFSLNLHSKIVNYQLTYVTNSLAENRKWEFVAWVNSEGCDWVH